MKSKISLASIINVLKKTANLSTTVIYACNTSLMTVSISRSEMIVEAQSMLNKFDIQGPQERHCTNSGNRNKF